MTDVLTATPRAQKFLRDHLATLLPTIWSLEQVQAQIAEAIDDLEGDERTLTEIIYTEASCAQESAHRPVAEAILGYVERGDIPECWQPAGAVIAVDGRRLAAWVEPGRTTDGELCHDLSSDDVSVVVYDVSSPDAPADLLEQPRMLRLDA